MSTNPRLRATAECDGGRIKPFGKGASLPIAVKTTAYLSVTIAQGRIADVADVQLTSKSKGGTCAQAHLRK